MMSSRLHTRFLAVVAAFALATGAVACSDDVSPVAPGLGFAEADTLVGALGTDSSTNASGFVANRNGDVTAVVCGPSDANFNAWAITNARTDSTKARIADTLATGTATSGCETLSFKVLSGSTYRFAVKSVTGRGSYIACYAYDATTCAGLQPTAPTPPNVPPGYYLGTAGLTGANLIAALNTIVKTGHNGFVYDSARGFLYQDVEDPDDDNLIEDVYAGRIATVDRRANSNTDAGDAGFNAEHAWPQSCGARLDRQVGTTPRSTGPRGDLNILFAADANANSSRSNFPFGLISGAAESSFGPDSAGNFSRRGTNAGHTVFEPRAEKRGDIARAIFYFYVRYVPEIPASLSLENFNVEEATLLQWAQQDPPDAFERARNNEVYAVQGNRNPFIDAPEFLTRIGDFPNAVAGTHATCDF